MTEEAGGPPPGEGEPDEGATRAEDVLREELRRLLSDDDTLACTLENLPGYARDLLGKAAAGEISEEEFLREVFVGDCPNCEGSNTVHCGNIEGIEDMTLGLCGDCGYSWCLECGASVERGSSCGHWDICEDCTEETDEFGECGVPPFECPNILEWMQGSGWAGLISSGCAWCGSSIGDDEGLFAVGASMREGVEFTGATGDPSGILPIVLGGRIIPAVLTSPDSEARREGSDLVFLACSSECAEALRVALVEEKNLHDSISLN